MKKPEVKIEKRLGKEKCIVHFGNRSFEIDYEGEELELYAKSIENILTDIQEEALIVMRKKQSPYYCMYCEKKLDKNEAIILCKKCTE